MDSKSSKQLVPSFSVYSRVGRHTVTFRRIREDMGCIDEKHMDLLGEFHKHIVEEYAQRYSDSSISYNPHSHIATKLVIVPLAQHVISELGENGGQSRIDTWSLKDILDNEIFAKCLNSDSPVTIPLDFEVLEQLYLGSVVSRPYLGEKRTRRYYVTNVLESIKASNQMTALQTFAEYYKENYDVQVNLDQHLLEFVPAPSRVSFAKDEFKKEKLSRPKRKDYLIPELCPLERLPCDLHSQVLLLSHAFYRLESLLQANVLQTEMCHAIIQQTSANNAVSSHTSGTHVARVRDLTAFKSGLHDLSACLQLDERVSAQSNWPTVETILEALTTRQAHASIDLERLEMLGDSFLKQAVTIYLFVAFPLKNEGRLSVKRKRVVSNKNLSRIAKSKEITGLICNTHFSVHNPNAPNQNPKTVWVPPLYEKVLSGDENMDMDEERSECDCKFPGPYQEVQDKSLADVVEALIGAFFQSGGVNLALEFMQCYLGIDVLFRQISDEPNLRTVSDSQSCYADYPMLKSSARSAASKSDIDALYRKLNPPSGRESVEKKIGYIFNDKAHLIQAMTHLSYCANTVTGCYQEFEFLGDAILDFLITLHVYNKRKTLSPGELTSLRSAIVNNNTFGLLAVKLDLYKFLLQMSPGLFHSYDAFVKVLGDTDIDDYLESPFVIVPAGSEEGYEAPKVLGDLFESLAGAIFIDSNFNLLKVWEVYYPILQPVIDKYMDEIPLNPFRSLKEGFTDAKVDAETDNLRCWKSGASIFRRSLEDPIPWSLPSTLLRAPSSSTHSPLNIKSACVILLKEPVFLEDAGNILRTRQIESMVECRITFNHKHEERTITGLGRNKKIAKATASTRVLAEVRQ